MYTAALGEKRGGGEKRSEKGNQCRGAKGNHHTKKAKIRAPNFRKAVTKEVGKRGHEVKVGSAPTKGAVAEYTKKKGGKKREREKGKSEEGGGRRPLG